MSDLKIRFLGTGTSQGVPVIGCSCEVCTSTDSRDKRTRTSALIEYQGKSILIDCGPDFRQQFLLSGRNNIDAVLLTHEHRDHTAGLDDLRPICFKYDKAVDIYSQKRTLGNIRKDYRYVFEETVYVGLPKFKMLEIEGDFFVGDVKIQPIQVLHHKLPILGFRINNLAYITDCKTIPEKELEKLRGLEVLVLNALQIEEHISHMNLEQAMQMVELLKPKKAFLTHISHYLGRHEVINQKLRGGNISLAYDGLEVSMES